jgi:Raf kinase inhibitor-like YbhB/YbcL family protein
MIRILLLGLWLSLGTGCDGQTSDRRPPPPKEGERTMALQISSPAFQPGQPIPPKDLSPALAWSGAPAGTKSFALLCDDPDAPMGTWVHWVIFNIPADSTGLPEGVPALATPPSGGVQGKNSWKKVGYGGPCPPPGKAHRYFFRLYALDATLALDSSADEAKVQAAMKGHVVAQGELMGTFRR